MSTLEFYYSSIYHGVWSVSASLSAPLDVCQDTMARGIAVLIVKNGSGSDSDQYAEAES